MERERERERDRERVGVEMHSFHLGASNADDAVDTAVGIEKEGNSDGVLAGGEPVAFGGRVNLEHVRTGAEDGLFPSGQNKQTNKRWDRYNSEAV